MTSKKILLVGGCGYIGGTLTDQLIEKGHNVTVFDNLTYENYYLKNVPFVFGDIRDTKKLLSIHENFDEVIWLAALVGDGACAQDPDLTYEINTNAPKRFLQSAQRPIIFPSTCSVYGAQEGLLTEKNLARPLSVYAETKLKAEEEVLAHGGMAFRLGTLFGLGDSYSRLRLDLVVNVLTLKALTTEKITVFGGDQWRPILAVRDVACYFVEAVEHFRNDVFNIALKNVRIRDLAEDFRSVFPGLQVEYVDRTFEDLRNYRVSTEKAEAFFKFRPQISVRHEIEVMHNVLREGRIKNPSQPIYYNANYVKSTLQDLRNY